MLAKNDIIQQLGLDSFKLLKHNPNSKKYVQNHMFKLRQFNINEKYLHLTFDMCYIFYVL